MKQRRLLHHGIAWLLSAALLLTNGLPISVEHAHHISGDLAHHRHGSDLASPRSSGTNVGAPAAVDDVTDHLHLLWLGWEFAVPAPQDQPPGTHAATSVELLARLETLGDSQTRAAASRPGHDTALDILTLASASSPAASHAAANFFLRAASLARPLAALPLCDIARHARSGVQLA